MPHSPPPRDGSPSFLITASNLVTGAGTVWLAPFPFFQAGFFLYLCLFPLLVQLAPSQALLKMRPSPRTFSSVTTKLSTDVVPLQRGRWYGLRLGSEEVPVINSLLVSKREAFGKQTSRFWVCLIFNLTKSLKKNVDDVKLLPWIQKP